MFVKIYLDEKDDVKGEENIWCLRAEVLETRKRMVMYFQLLRPQDGKQVSHSCQHGKSAWRTQSLTASTGNSGDRNRNKYMLAQRLSPALHLQIVEIRFSFPQICGPSAQLWKKEEKISSPGGRRAWG